MYFTGTFPFFQMRVDRYATFSGLIGGGATFAAKRTILPGLLLGFTFGTITGGIHNNMNK